jgi:hypothetical protein
VSEGCWNYRTHGEEGDMAHSGAESDRPELELRNLGDKITWPHYIRPSSPSHPTFLNLDYRS